MRTAVYLLAGCAAMQSLRAQNPLGSVTINTNPGGLYMYVDGTHVRAPQAYVWPQGSKHTISVDATQAGIGCTAYTFKRWSEASGNLLDAEKATITVTADPSLSNFTASFDFAWGIHFSLGTDDPNSGSYIIVSPGPPSSGIRTDTWWYYQPHSTVRVEAVPGPGMVFNGWHTSFGSDSNAFIKSFSVDSPCMNIAPYFSPARQAQLETEPEALLVAVDRTDLRAPIALDWGMGSVHTLAPVSPQIDEHSRVWVFRSWSDGGDYQHAFTVPKDSTMPVKLKATYVRGAGVTFTTNAVGLRFNVDGRDAAAPYNSYWGVGDTHTVTLPPQFRDTQGRMWQFKGWSNQGPVKQTITVDEDHLTNGVRMHADYQVNGLIKIDTYPPAMTISIDGQECRAPCSVDRPIGANLSIAAPQSIAVSDGVRLDLETAPGSITATENVQNVLVSYRTMNRLSVSSTPDSAIRWRFDPDPQEGYFPAQTMAVVTAEAKPGFKFLRWDGDLTGVNKTAPLAMDRPRNVVAVADRIPYVDPAGVKNAAGQTPDAVVAPGSVAVIQGVSLAPESASGSQKILAQTLANVTVRWGARYLPLFSVSPDEIRVQLPSDMPEGEQTLIVSWQGKPDVKASLIAARNAPGIFQAMHADGSAVTAESPAKHGEVVTLLATGLGPYANPYPDGFAVPAGTQIALADTVDVVAGDAHISPLFTAAAPDRVGMQVVQFAIGNDIPASSPVGLRVNVNGRDSNTLLLPVE